MVTVEERALAIARLKAWIARLPPSMVDLPVLVLLGFTLTPRQMLEEATEGTELGNIIIDRELKMASALMGR